MFSFNPTSSLPSKSALQKPRPPRVDPAAATSAPGLFTHHSSTRAKHENHVMRSGANADEAWQQITLGEDHLRSGRYEQAEECFGNALEIRRRVKGRNSLEVVQVYERLGDTASKYKELWPRVQWRYDAALSILDRMMDHDDFSGSAAGEMQVYKCRILLKKCRALLGMKGNKETTEAFRSFREAMKSPGLPSKRHKPVAVAEQSTFVTEKITDVLIQVGELLADKGDYDKALTAFLEVLRTISPFPGCNPAVKSSQEQLGKKVTCHKLTPIRPLTKEDVTVVEVLKRIAVVYDRKGEYEEAVKWYNIAMDLMTHDDMWDFFTYKDAFNLCGNTVCVLKKMGDFSKVIEWYEEALRECIEDMGPNHDVVATIYNKFGNDYREAGMYDEAVQCFKKEGKIRVIKNDDDDNTKHTAAVLVRIAATYRLWGKSDKALVYYRDAIDSLIPVEYRGSKTTNPDWLSEKLEHVEDALVGLPADSNEDFIAGHTLTKNDVAKFINDMGNLFHLKSSFNSAVTCYQHSCKMRLVRNDVDRQERLRIQFNIAKARFGAGSHEEALGLLTETLQEQKKLLKGPNLDVANTLHEIGVIQMKNHAFNEAIGYFENSLAMKEQILGSNHQDVLGTKYNIAFALFKMGHIGKAISEFDDVLMLQAENLGESHAETAKTQCMLGTANASLGRYVDALQFFEEALQARKAVLGEEDALVGKTLACIAVVHMALGNYDEAQALSDDALTVYQSAKLRRSHPYLVEVRRMSKKIDDYKSMSTPPPRPKNIASRQRCSGIFSLLSF